MKCPLSSHPLRNTIRLQLKSSPLLAMLDEAAREELYELLLVQEGHRGERLLEQGSRDLRHFFVVEGVIKRVVTNSEGREMTLHFAGEGEMETSFDAWRRNTGASFAIVCA